MVIPTGKESITSYLLGDSIFADCPSFIQLIYYSANMVEKILRRMREAVRSDIAHF